MRTNLTRYQRIAPLYDFLDQPFERKRYAGLRPLLFDNLGGRLLDWGRHRRQLGLLPARGADVAGITRARLRCPTLVASGQLYQMDVADLQCPAESFVAAVASFLLCVLRGELQLTGLYELGRVVKSGGIIRVLEYVRPKRHLRTEPGCGSPGSPEPMAQALTDKPSVVFRPPVWNWSKAVLSSTIC